MTETTTRSQKAFAVLYLAARYYAAFTLLTYGFAKIMGAQFTVLDSQLAKPMGDVSGFWLTWYYFGYSPVYSNIVAIMQIVGAVLLCFRRTSLIAAVTLLPVMVNIVCIDYWVIGWRLDSSALRNAICVLAAIVIVIGFHAKSLFMVLLQKRDDLAIFKRSRGWIVLVQVAIVTVMVAYKAHEGYWLANVNNRAPTPIDGAWRVIDVQPALADVPSWIYFEYNRAFMAVFQFPDGHTETHDFRLGTPEKSLAIGRQWLTAGSDIFNGRWNRTGDTLEIRGVWGNSTTVDMTLKRKMMSVNDHQ